MRWETIDKAPADMRPILAYSPGTWELPPEWAVVFKKRDGWVYQEDDHLYMDGITHFALLTKP